MNKRNEGRRREAENLIYQCYNCGEHEGSQKAGGEQVVETSRRFLIAGLLLHPEIQKDQENGRKENGMIAKTQRSAISNDGRERAEGMRRKLGQGPMI
jgi:hypothetical protein